MADYGSSQVMLPDIFQTRFAVRAVEVDEIDVTTYGGKWTTVPGGRAIVTLSDGRTVVTVSDWRFGDVPTVRDLFDLSVVPCPAEFGRTKEETP